MGHKQIDKTEVQKNRLKSVFYSMLQTNIAIIKFQLTLTEKEEEIKALKKVIKMSGKAQDIIFGVKHIEILISLYNSFINNKEAYFIQLMRVITLKTTISKWDKTEKGFNEFLKMEASAKAKSEQELKEQQDRQEFVKKAQAEGKKVEFVLKDGKLQPTIVEEKAN